MDINVDTGDPTHIDEWWVGYLSTTMARALRHRPLEGGRLILERALREFKASPVCTPAVRRHLQKGETE